MVVNKTSFSQISRFFCIVGGLLAIWGGLNLVCLRAAAEDSIIQSIANYIGWYCLGKGIFMIAVSFQIKGAVNRLLGE